MSTLFTCKRCGRRFANVLHLPMHCVCGYVEREQAALQEVASVDLEQIREHNRRIASTEPKRSRGLGDTIAKLTATLGIMPCNGCKERQAKLNKIMPYSKPNGEST